MKTRILTKIVFCILMVSLVFVASACEQTPQTETPPVATPDPTPVPPLEPAQDGADVASGVQWLSPMLSISVSENEASIFAGELVVNDTNDFGRENRGMVVTEIPEEGQDVVPARLTSAQLIAGGAVRMTANFAYEGDNEYNIRFRVRADMFQGHSITAYGIGAATDVLVLFEDEDGVWWNMRRTGWGGEFTGGTDTPGWFFPAGHESAGEPYPVFTFDISRETAMDFATKDFYIVFLEEAPLRTNEVGVVTDETAGFVITYQAESPDADGHFHNFNIIASASTYIHIPGQPGAHDHDHDDHDHDHDHEHDDHDDDDDHGHAHDH